MFPGGAAMPQARLPDSGSMSDEQKVAVITGGASGIGLATASLLATQGWRLVLADVEAPRLEMACARTGGRSSGGRSSHRCGRQGVG